MLTATCDCDGTEQQKSIVNRNVFLEGVSLEEVNIWADKINNPEQYLKSQLKDLPISIHNN